MTKQKIIAGSIIGIVVVSICAIIISLSLGGSCSQKTGEQKRQNTLSLVRHYVEKEEFDRALSLLESLLISNPEDADASELLDLVLGAKRAKQALASGNSSMSLEEVEQALALARAAASRIAAAADQAARAAQRMDNQANTNVATVQGNTRAQELSRSEYDYGLEFVGAEQTRAQGASRAEQERAKQEEAARAEQEQLKQEQALAQEAKRKQLEQELAQKNEHIKKQIEQAQTSIDKGKKSAESGNLRSTLSNFDQASAELPVGENAFNAQKYLEMSETLFDLAQESQDNTLKTEGLTAALEYANKAITQDPTQAHARYIRAQINDALNKKDAQIADLKEAVRLDPKNYLYAYELGKAYYVQKKYTDAKTQFANVTSLKPDFETAFYNLGLTNKMLGQTSAALQAFRGATKIKSDYTKAHIEIARILDRQGDYNGAEASFLSALKTEPSNMQALRELATSYTKLGNYLEAERYYREALVLGSNDGPTNYNMATVLLELNKNEAALDYAKKASEIEPKNAVFLYTYGLAGERAGMKDIAVQQYAQAIAADQKYVKPRINISTIFLDADRIDDAINQLQTAWALEKDNFEVNNNLGKAYGLKQQFDKSVDHYARAMAKNPKDPDVRANLAFAYTSAGLTEKARDIYVDLIALQPTRWDAYYELGKIHISLGSNDKAKQIFSDLLQKNPSYVRAAEIKALISTL